MHTRISIPFKVKSRQYNSDGSLKFRRTVDQFPAIRANRGKSGYPANDVALFVVASSSLSQRGKLDALMQHIHMLRAEKSNEGKSIRELIDECISAYFQKPAEIIRAYEYASERFAQPVTTDEVKDEVSEVKPSEQSSE